MTIWLRRFAGWRRAPSTAARSGSRARAPRSLRRGAAREACAGRSRRRVALRRGRGAARAGRHDGVGHRGSVRSAACGSSRRAVDDDRVRPLAWRGGAADFRERSSDADPGAGVGSAVARPRAASDHAAVVAGGRSCWSGRSAAGGSFVAGFLMERRSGGGGAASGGVRS